MKRIGTVLGLQVSSMPFVLWCTCAPKCTTWSSKSRSQWLGRSSLQTSLCPPFHTPSHLENGSTETKRKMLFAIVTRPASLIQIRRRCINPSPGPSIQQPPIQALHKTVQQRMKAQSPAHTDRRGKTNLHLENGRCDHLETNLVDDCRTIRRDIRGTKLLYTHPVPSTRFVYIQDVCHSGTFVRGGVGEECKCLIPDILAKRSRHVKF